MGQQVDTVVSNSQKIVQKMIDYFCLKISAIFLFACLHDLAIFQKVFCRNEQLILLKICVFDSFVSVSLFSSIFDGRCVFIY